MEQEKKAVILDEIDHWRKSRLLPKQYCDFLENLYADEHIHSRRGKSIIQKMQHGSRSIWFLVFGIISSICFIGLYFSAFPKSMQIGIAAISATGCYAAAAYFRKKGLMPWAHMCASAGSVILLAAGSVIIHLQEADVQIWVPVLIGVCSLSWCLVGYWLNMSLLHYCGLLGGAVLYAKLAAYNRPDLALLQTELLWIPLSVLFIWLSWLVHHRMKSLAPVYFSFGLTLWFMAELDQLVLKGAAVQDVFVWLLIKLTAAAVLLFLFRKNWITWVSS